MCCRGGALADLDHHADSQGVQVAAKGAMHAYADGGCPRIARMLQDPSLSEDRVADIISGGRAAAHRLNCSPDFTSSAAVWRRRLELQLRDSALACCSESLGTILLCIGGCLMTNIWSYQHNACCPGRSRGDCAGRSSNPHTNHHNQSSTVIAISAVLCLVHFGQHLLTAHQ